ncbi:MULTISPECIES: response regulator transcription factor [unclassified Diaminobutyricimonas]|uniref:response regulator transcription factor n=1 Tax=unclassified Diaminobutyricimonas TaxID=2643261 RepID=UPI0012F5143A|nr:MULTISPECIES: response regulator transcription factor [unclassified Diaminobutyricimonas]
MSSILVVEDEERISAFVAKGLTAAGYACRVTDNGLAAVELARSDEFDLILLDVGLPGIDGFEVLRRVRGFNETVPIIMLTARTATVDTVAGLDGGANDYLAKPFKFDELVARVRSRMRDASRSSAASTVLVHDDLSLDMHSRRASIDSHTVDLSAREFALLEEFMRHPDQVLSREQLLSRVWGYDFDPGSNVVDVYVRYLRGKLGSDRIETVRGMGYRLR